jgi:hypothetical protein
MGKLYHKQSTVYDRQNPKIDSIKPVPKQDSRLVCRMRQATNSARTTHHQGKIVQLPRKSAQANVLEELQDRDAPNSRNPLFGGAAHVRTSSHR